MYKTIKVPNDKTPSTSNGVNSTKLIKLTLSACKVTRFGGVIQIFLLCKPCRVIKSLQKNDV